MIFALHSNQKHNPHNTSLVEKINASTFQALLIVSILSVSCMNKAATRGTNAKATLVESNISSNRDSVVYSSDKIRITRLSDHVYVHTSFLNTNSFGRVECNGMVAVNAGEVVVFDTPTDDSGSAELINYITRDLKGTIKAIVPTHFHEDCVGGLKKFSEHAVPIYVSARTVDLLRSIDYSIPTPTMTFNDSVAISVGDLKVYAEYPGQGHTKDNIIGWFPTENAIFGGCLVKESGANEGFLGDANVLEWPKTVRKLKSKYPGVQIVIPGHGKPGDVSLLDYTIQLFE